jgi:excisionase family DNA binding protein
MEPSASALLRVDCDLAPLVDEIARRVADVVLERLADGPDTPWMLMDEAIAYTRIPDGTFKKWVAEGRIPSHGGKRRLFHRRELDLALGYRGARLGGPLPRLPATSGA